MSRVERKVKERKWIRSRNLTAGAETIREEASKWEEKEMEKGRNGRKERKRRFWDRRNDEKEWKKEKMGSTSDK